MEDVREREAASCIRGYREDHPSTSDTSRATFFPSTELRNEAARLCQEYRTKFLLFKNYFEF